MSLKHTLLEKKLIVESKIRKSLLAAACIFLTVPSGAATASYDHTHSKWNEILTQYVNDDGYVDYKTLVKERKPLDEYLDLIKIAGPKTRSDSFATQDQKLAYYLNAYNALVFKGVLDRGPEMKSVWRGLISGLNFFVRMDVYLDGTETNLKKLEDDLVRDQFKDPRIHAALNCASISCPRLPKQPFTAKGLDAQLDRAMSEFVNTGRHARVDAAKKTVYLSKIFDWFDSDFLSYERALGNADPSLIDYVNRFRQTPVPGDYKVKFLDYDKSINSIENAKSLGLI